jgi:hypothetical protein
MAGTQRFVRVCGSGFRTCENRPFWEVEGEINEKVFGIRV